MPELLEGKNAEELRRDIAAAERELRGTQERLAYLYDAGKSEDGAVRVTADQARQIADLEGRAAAQGDRVNAIKFEYGRLRNAENLSRGKHEPFPAVGLFDGAAAGSGSGTARSDNPTLSGQVAVLPDNLTDAFTSSSAYKSWQQGAPGQTASIELPIPGGVRSYAFKATLTTATGPFTSIDKQPSVVQLGQQQLTIADLYSQGQTSSPTIRYIQEDTFTNAAGMVAEEGAKPEFTWDLSEIDAVVRKIAGITKMSDESIKDFPMLRTYIDERLPFAIRQREELQLISGDGTGQNLLGILNVPGILTQAQGTDGNIDAIYKAITKIRTQGFFEPDGVVIHPDNWTVIRLYKTTQGEYQYGHPAVAGPETIFGKRVVITANMPVNSAVVGAFRIGGTVFYREGLRVEATNTDQDDFIKNRITLRAEQREVPVYWRPKAFCKVTGLAV